MKVDFSPAEQAIEKLKTELGLEGSASSVQCDSWVYLSGHRELRIKLFLFDGNRVCHIGTGPTWQHALMDLRTSFASPAPNGDEVPNDPQP